MHWDASRSYLVAPFVLIARDARRVVSSSKVDAKLQRLIDDPTEALTARERALAVEHIARAAFSAESRPVVEWSKGFADVRGEPHPTKAGEVLEDSTLLTSAEWHTVKRVVQGHWTTGTTTSEYLADIAAAVRSPGAVLDVGKETIRVSGATRPASRAGVRVGRLRGVKKAVALPVDSVMVTMYDVARKKLVTCFPKPLRDAEKDVQRWANHRSFP